MNQVKQVQQLRKDGVLIKEIVRRVGISRKTVKKYLRRMEELPQQSDSYGMDGKMVLVLADKELAAIVYDNDKAPTPCRRYEDLLKHFEYAKKECQKTGINKQIL